MLKNTILTKAFISASLVAAAAAGISHASAHTYAPASLYAVDNNDPSTPSPDSSSKALNNNGYGSSAVGGDGDNPFQVPPPDPNTTEGYHSYQIPSNT